MRLSLQTVFANSYNHISTVMKHLYCCLLLMALAFTTLGQNVVRAPCLNFPINENDSVCLNAQVNITPEEVERIIRNGQDNILLIFDGWVNWAKRLLSSNNLKNAEIVRRLKKYRIITLYVDDRVVVDAKDSTTVGKRNLMYQMDRFQAVTQPYYIIMKGGKAKCSSGYLSTPEEVLALFKRCER
jgi:hypothetical protein